MLADPVKAPTMQRHWRALEALEMAGTPEAKKLLRRLSRGNPKANWTEQAKLSVDRLDCRSQLVDVPGKRSDAFGDSLPAGVLARLGSVRLQGGDWPTLTSDGKTLIAVSDRYLHAWDVASARPLPGFPKSGNWPDASGVAISSDSTRIAVAFDHAHSFDIREFPSGKRLHRHRGSGSVHLPYRYPIAFNADGSRLVVTNPQNIEIWNVAAGKQVAEFSHTGGIAIAVLSTNAKHLATISGQGLRVWDVEKGKLLHHLQKGYVYPFSAAISADGTRVVSADSTGVSLWDVGSGMLSRQLPLISQPRRGDRPPSFAFSADGMTLALTDITAKGNPELTTQIWDLAKKDSKPRILASPGLGRIEAFTPDGKSLLWRSHNSYRVLDVASGKDRHDWTSRGAVHGIDWSRDGTRIATVCSDSTVAIWDAQKSSLLHVLRGHRSEIQNVTFSPDGKLLVSCGNENEPAIVWDAVRGIKLTQVLNKNTGVRWAGFSANSNLLLASGHDVHGSIFGARNGVLQRHFNTDGSSTWNMAYAADGRHVAMGIDGVHVVDVINDKKLPYTFPMQSCVAQAISPDGRSLAASETYGQVVVWEILTGRERVRLKFPPKSYQPSGRLVFSPDNRMLVAVAHWRPAPPTQVWDLATGQSLGFLRGHADRINAVAFAPDGRHIATASADGTVLIRDLHAKPGT
jgi:WD40 repeat protein